MRCIAFWAPLGAWPLTEGLTYRSLGLAPKHEAYSDIAARVEGRIGQGADFRKRQALASRTVATGCSHATQLFSCFSHSKTDSNLF